MRWVLAIVVAIGCGRINYDPVTPRDGDVTPADAPPDADCSTTTAMISAGYLHTCVVRRDSSAWCWGQDFYHQLGDGSTTSSPKPVAVVGMARDVATIAAGGGHT